MSVCRWQGGINVKEGVGEGSCWFGLVWFGGMLPECVSGAPPTSMYHVQLAWSYLQQVGGIVVQTQLSHA